MNKNNKVALSFNSAKDLNSQKSRIQKCRNVPKELTLFIPENLDIDKLLSEKPPTFEFYWDRDCFVYLLNLINDIPSRKKDMDCEYTPFYSPLVQRRVKEYRTYLNYLIEHSIIKTDNQYIQGSKSIGYTYTSYYQTKIKPIKISKPTLIKSILKFIELDNSEFEDCKSRESIINTDIGHLTKWLNRGLKIDYEGSIKYLKEKYEIDLKSQDYSGQAMKKFNSRLVVVEKIHNGDFNYTIDNTAGRLHTVLTQIKSELRNFITYKGQKLVAIDIKNSQPYLSYVLLNPEKFNFVNLRKYIQYYNPFLKNDISKFNDLYNDIILSDRNSDTQKYRSLISNGNLYESIGQILKSKGLIKSEDLSEIRKEAKSRVISSMFSPNRAIGYKVEMKEFASEFPTIYKIFSKVKFKKHNSLACMLQNLEANLVLHTACKIIANERPNLPIFTIHDSIITTKGNEEYVKGVLHKVLYEHIGLPPKLKEEKWEISLVA
jgi:hypothetical protein